MDFYEIDVRGKFLLERRASHPSPERGRLYYHRGDDSVYYNDSTTSFVVWGENNLSTLASCLGATGLDADTLDGQHGAYYQCADNLNAGTVPSGRLTGTYNISVSGTAANATCASDSDTLDGQQGTYYNCMNNATGTLALGNGGTGGTTAATARTNLELTGNSNTTHYHDGRYYTESESDSRFGRLASNNIWGSGTCNCFCYNSTRYAYISSTSTPTIGLICTTNSNCLILWSDAMSITNFTTTTNGIIEVCHCPSSSSGAALWVRSCNAKSICAYREGSLAIDARATSCYALFGQAGSCRGIYGVASSYYGAMGESSTGRPVAGNGAYYNTSSRYLKHTRPICISECLRCRPLPIYKYSWEDSNMRGFEEHVGPVAEEYEKTFNLGVLDANDEYSGLYTMDGVALGLGIENLNEIDKLKQIVIQLYSCIKKLENN